MNFVGKIITAHNSLYFVNKVKQDVYWYELFSFFLGAECDPEILFPYYVTPRIRNRNELNLNFTSLILILLKRTQ